MGTIPEDAGAWTPEWMKEASMFYELEMRLVENDVAEDVTRACAKVLGNVATEVKPQDFDATVTASGDIPAHAAYAIARELRNGRDFDRTKPSEWHVRSILRDETDGPAGTTTISLCQSFMAPEEYGEKERA